jgi:hypothetical protein
MRRIAMTTLLALVLAGCGGSSSSSSDKPASVPSGFKTMNGQGYSFAYPSSWQTLDNIEGGQGAQGPKGTGGLAPQAAVGRGEVTASLDNSVDGFIANNRIRRAGWKVVKDVDYDLDGAKDAHLIEATYNEVTSSSATTPVRTIDVLVQTDKGVALDLFLRAPEADFDRVRLREVLDTFRLK